MREHRLGVALAILVVVLSGGSAFANITANPTSLTCPSTSVGTESNAATTTLSKGSGPPAGTATLGNCSGAAGTFNFSPTFDTSVKATFDVTYTPTAMGTRTCEITFSNGMGTDAVVTVSGNGVVPPMIAVSTPSNFGQQRVLDTALASHSSTRTVTVQNDGGAVLNITNVTLTGDFSIDPSSPNNTMTTVNGGGGTKNWTIRFNPSAAGSRTGTLTFDSNAGQRSVPLAGDGTTGSFAISASNNGNFGTVASGTSAGLDIAVTHDGGAPKGILTFGTVTVTNASANWFSVVAQPTTLNGTTTTGTVTVRCSPPALATSTEMATINISADADSAPMKTQQVMCQGGASVLALAVSTVDMDPTLVGSTSGTKTIIVTNTGTSNANVGFASSSTNASRFSVHGPNGCGVSAMDCPVAMGGGTLTITMEFSPNAEGSVSASFNINGAGAASSFIVNGRGIDRHIQVPEAVQFADTFKNPHSKATIAPVTIENKGEYQIVVSGYQVGAGSEVWSVDESMTTFPLMVPGLSTADVMVKFEPREAGKATDGQLLLANDDMKVAGGMPIVILSGNGKNRNVDMLPGSIPCGDTFAGIETRYSITHANEVDPPKIKNNEMPDGTTNDFTIRKVEIIEPEMRPYFEIVDMSGNSLDGRMIKAGEEIMIDVIFKPTYNGDFQASLGLYLDEDEESQTPITVRGRALYLDAHGSGGCSTGHGSGGIVLVLGALGFIVRRRRR